jgi:hypothetical protein
VCAFSFGRPGVHFYHAEWRRASAHSCYKARHGPSSFPRFTHCQRTAHHAGQYAYAFGVGGLGPSRECSALAGVVRATLGVVGAASTGGGALCRLILFLADLSVISFWRASQ